MDKDFLREKILRNTVINPLLKRILTQTDRHVDAVLPYFEGCEAVYQNKTRLILGMLGLHKINQETPLSPKFVSLKFMDIENLEHRYSDFAEKEIKDDFSILISSSIVMLFTILDSTLKSFVVGWYLNNYSTLTNKVKDRVRKFPEDVEEHDPDEFWVHLRNVLREEVMILKTETNNNHLTTLDYAELFFQFLELNSNTLSVDVKRNLDELHHIRNLIIHNNLAVNHAFIQKCPWIDVGIGESIKLTIEDYERYDDSVSIYFSYLFDRVIQFYA